MEFLFNISSILTSLSLSTNYTGILSSAKFASHQTIANFNLTAKAPFPVSNQTSSSGDGLVPSHVTEDYIQIGFLASTLLIGGTLNLISFIRILQNYRQQIRSNEKTLHTAFLLFKAHLNAAGIFVLLFHNTYSFGWLITYKWIAGDFLCKLLNFLSTFSFHLSSNMVAGIAIDRVYNVCKMSFLTSKRAGSRRRKESMIDKASPLNRAKVIVFVAWSLAVVFTGPQLAIWRTIELDMDWHQCVTLWDEHRFNQFISGADISEMKYPGERAYSVTHLVTVFFVPLAIIMSAYFVIVLKLLALSHKSFSSVPGAAHSTSVNLSPNILTTGEKQEQNGLLTKSNPNISVDCESLELLSTRKISDAQQSTMGNRGGRRYFNASYYPSRLFTSPTASPVLMSSTAIGHSNEAKNSHCLSERKILSPSKNRESRGYSNYQASLIQRQQSAENSNSLDNNTKHNSSTNNSCVIRRSTTAVPDWRLQMRCKMFRTSGCIVLAYIVFWLPYNVITVIGLFHPSLKALIAAHLNWLKDLIVLNAVLNPIIYEFRKNSRI